MREVICITTSLLMKRVSESGGMSYCGGKLGGPWKPGVAGGNCGGRTPPCVLSGGVVLRLASWTVLTRFSTICTCADGMFGMSGKTFVTTSEIGIVIGGCHAKCG